MAINKVKHYTPPLGVVYWAKWDRSKKPNLHVYKYLYTVGDEYIFMHRSGKFYFRIFLDALERAIYKKEFKPFLLNKAYFEHYNRNRGSITDAFI